MGIEVVEVLCVVVVAGLEKGVEAACDINVKKNEQGKCDLESDLWGAVAV